VAAYFAANGGTVEFGHQPIQQRQARTIFGGETLQSLATIFYGNHFVARAFQRFLKKMPRDHVVVGYEDSHRLPDPRKL
jgi:hypothetical protein